MTSGLHDWSVDEAVGEGTAVDWLGTLMQSLGGITFETQNMMMMLGQTAAFAQVGDPDVAREMVKDRRGDLADLRRATDKCVEVVEGMLANLEQNLEER